MEDDGYDKAILVLPYKVYNTSENAFKRLLFALGQVDGLFGQQIEAVDARVSINHGLLLQAQLLGNTNEAVALLDDAREGARLEAGALFIGVGVDNCSLDTRIVVDVLRAEAGGDLEHLADVDLVRVGDVVLLGDVADA